MPRMDHLSSYATTIATGADQRTRITYHSTIIVEFDVNEIVLRTGGYDTVTTRRKMNQASNQFNLGYGIGRKKGITYVTNRAGYGMPLQEFTRIDRAHWAMKAPE